MENYLLKTIYKKYIKTQKELFDPREEYLKVSINLAIDKLINRLYSDSNYDVLDINELKAKKFRDIQMENIEINRFYRFLSVYGIELDEIEKLCESHFLSYEKA